MKKCIPNLLFPFMLAGNISLFNIPLAAQLPRLILNEVYVDYSEGADYPLTKTKFNLYDAIVPSMDQFNEAVQIMGELNVETYRLELGWGRRFNGFGLNTMIGGTPDSITYDFEALDNIVTKLKEQDVLFHGAYSYCPFPLQDSTIAEHRDSRAPNDMQKWKEIITTVAQHYMDMGIPFGVDEVWNEADGLYVFYSGSEEEYKELYRITAEAVLAVNPDAFIAGPASAPELVWHRTFPEWVALEKLPMDGFTFHHYGSAELGLHSIDRVVASLNRFPYFNTTAMILDEWHSADLIEPWCRDDDVRSTFEGAGQLLHDFSIYLTRPELTSISWAWYLDPAFNHANCMGLITGDGHRKAVFNAWKIYGNMPVDRNKVRSIGPLEAMASSDAHNAAVVIWNRDPYQRRMDVHLKNLPFDKGDIRVYVIDSLHASYKDGGMEDLIPVETFSDVELSDWSYIDHIMPPQTVMYIEADDGLGLSDLDHAHVGEVLKVNHYYPERGTSSYADFDRKTWIARLGMVDERQADQEVGLVADELPDNIQVSVRAEGALQPIDDNSLLAIRIDYQVAGQYTKSVLFHGPVNGVDLYSRKRTAVYPWGTGEEAGQVIKVDDLTAFDIPLAAHAPKNWQGKAHIGFIMQNTGPHTRVVIKLR